MASEESKSLEKLEQLASMQHYAAIGQVAASWARFEYIIDDWTHRLARISAPIGVCLTSQIAGSGRKLDAFIALAELKHAKKRHLTALHEFAKKTSGLAERRNRAVHDAWDVDDILEPKRLEATARKKLRLELIPVATEEVLNLALEIQAHSDRFESLAGKALTECEEPRR